MKIITVALRDFAVPCPRMGSIEAHSGFGRSAAEGREIHGRVQGARAKSDSAYEAEVSVSRTFGRGGYEFRIDGRMDGISRNDPPKIEEIKTAFNVRELARRLAEGPFDHPYCLQLATYGYFYWLEHRVLPELAFHLVSIRNRQAHDLALVLDLGRYEQWLDRRLDELVSEAVKEEKRSARRRRTAARFSFPFENVRPGQVELMRTIEQGMNERRPMLIQAPTGMGKTVGVLYPFLKEAFGRGQRVVYVTPKNSQHAVAEDAVARFQERGLSVKSLTITAKAKICFKSEPVCDPSYCEYARDYYTKVYAEGVLDVLAKKRKLKARTFRELGERYGVCPFELQFDGSREADLVICDYNYVFSPRSAFGRMTLTGVDQVGKPCLVIDEAHNLPSRAMEYYSPSLSTSTLEQMRDGIRSIDLCFRGEAEDLLNDCVRAVVSCRPDGSSGPAMIAPPTEGFHALDSRLRALLARYLESGVEVLPGDAVLRLCYSWSEFVEALEYAVDPARREFFTTFHPHSTGGTVKIVCCDASAMLTDCYNDYGQVVGFSATLKPFGYYAKLSGLNPESVKTAEFSSPFPREHRKLLIIPQVSTKYADRDRNYPRIADAVGRIAALRKGNYFVFLPSFEFLERVSALFQPPAGFTVLRQERDMKASSVATVLEQLRDGSAPTILFAVQGGTFSEGVDYPGEMAIGAFVVGPPLPNFDLERELMRRYYEEQYGDGFVYAYAIPAMAKAVQAAGRVIRSETERGLIVLMDGRFVQPGYSRSMPSDWFENTVSELVSDGILKDVADFWAKTTAGKTECPHRSGVS